jgi:hypothetical protein
MICEAGCSEPPVPLLELPARNRELATEELRLRKELVKQCVSLYVCDKADCFVMCFDNMPGTLSEVYVGTAVREFKHNNLGCSDNSSKVLKTFCYNNY